MAETLGFSVRIFIPTGEPEGLRIIEKSNWTGQGLFFPRIHLFTGAGQGGVDAYRRVCPVESQ